MYSVVLAAALTVGGGAPDCHGCCGCYGGWGCGGCYGCWGGCYGGCMGCYGGCMGCYGGGMGCYGCWGGYSGWGGYAGYGVSTYPGGALQGGAFPQMGTQGEQLPPTNPEKGTGKGTMLTPTKAKLIVDLPANSKLFIDDMPIKATPGLRSFNTPTLTPGQAYYYMVRVETVRDGKTVSESRRVIVRAGQVARADFKDLDSDAVRTVQAK